MNPFAQIVSLVKDATISGGIGFEGPPFSGKTTAAERLAALEGGELIAEHTVFCRGLRHLAARAWPDLVAEILHRQERFLACEVERSRRFLRSAGGAIMDRTLLSLIAHLHVRSLGSPDYLPLMQGFLAACYREVDAGSLALPSQIIYLETAFPTLCDRAELARQMGDSRDTEPFLQHRATIHRLSAFFRELASRLPENVLFSGDLPEGLRPPVRQILAPTDLPTGRER